MCICACTNAQSFSLGKKNCPIIFRCTKLRVLHTLNRRYYACAVSGPYLLKYIPSSFKLKNLRVFVIYCSYTVYTCYAIIYFFSHVFLSIYYLVSFYLLFFLILFISSFLCTSNFLFYKVLIMLF